MTRYSWVRCPNCRHQIESASGRAPRYYGDPHTTCPKCGASFLHPWVIELAFFPKDWYVSHHRKFWYIPLTIPVAFIPAILMFIWFDTVSRYINPGIIMLFCFALWMVLVIFCTLKTTVISVNETGFDKAYKESEERLSDPAYRKELENSRYYKQMVGHIHQ